MTYPPGVQLATLTFSNPSTFLGNEATRTELTVQSTAGVVWAATGQPIDDFAEVVSPGEGMPGSLTAPFVDQPGITDQAGNVFTMWAYILTRKTYFGGAVKTVRKNWQPLLGQTEVDFDNLPGGSIGLPVSAPPVPVTSVAGLTLAVGAEDLAGELVPFLPEVTPETVEANLPERLAPESLNATIGAQVAPKLDKTSAAATYATPRGNRVVFLGDSTLQGPTSDNPYNGTTRRFQGSWPVLASVASGQRIRIVKHAGVWGNTTQQMIDRFTAAVADHTPDVVVILTGRNDTSADQTLTGVQTLVGLVRGIGALPVICTPLPTNVADQKQRMATTATKLRTWASNNRLPVIDFYTLATDINGNLKAEYNSGDGIHPPPGGIKLMGTYAEPIISALMPPAPILTPVSDPDTDNLVLNPFFQGIDVGFSIGGWSRGSTNPWSTYTTVDVAGWRGKALQISTVAEGTVVPDAQIRQNINPGASTYAVGDVLEYVGKINITASTLPDGKKAMARVLFEGANETISAFETHLTASGTWRIRHTVPAGTTSLRIQFLVNPDAAGAATVQFGEVAIRNLTKLGVA